MIETWKKDNGIYFIEIFGKPIFLESALFHNEMVGLNNFGLDICIVNSKIFIKNISQTI